MIKINEDNKKFVDEFIRDFLRRMETLEDVKKYTKAEIVLYISEILGTKYESESLIKLCNNLIEELVNEIEENKLQIRGIFSDLGVFAFAVNNIHKKTKDLENLTVNLNEILLDYGNSIVSIQKLRKVSMGDYDCISGVSGILYYLLDTDINKLDKEKLNNLIEYLIWLTGTHEYRGHEVINFHIENEMLFRDDERDEFKNGNINFGLAHGMSGVLAALLKLYEMEFYDGKDTLLNAIDTIFNLYEEFENIVEGIPHYPRQLDFGNYINNIKDENYNNGSWCYGNISNVLVLFKGSKLLNWKNRYLKYNDYLKNIINQDIRGYLLGLSVLCHGYASIISEQLSLYEETKDETFIRTVDRNLKATINSYLSNNKYYSELENIDLNSEDALIDIQGHKDDFTLLCGMGGIFLSMLYSTNQTDVV